jgi:CubicO group peptidase (beta-lactamase class C family)
MRKTLFFLFLIGLLCLPVFAQKGLTDPQELETFLDSVMAAQLKEHNIGSATLAVVKDGKVWLKKGYGYVDYVNKAPIDPDRTIFRPGSVSKLFTWTAIMQLVDQGKIKLDDDVNKYLRDFQIKNPYPRPITIADLLTHTAGFDDSGASTMFTKYEQLYPLKDFLKLHQPPVILPPGKLASYSNYGTTLAGYIVESVSGLPYNEYIRQRIFLPLGMNSSTFDQKQTPFLAQNVASGNLYNNGKFEKQGFDYVEVVPAGALCSTAPDMAKFMLAHLTADPRLMKPATYRLMQAPHFGYRPGMNQMCYGFYELSRNSRRIIAHEGNVGQFASLLALFPNEQLGLFVSYSSMGGSFARNDLLKAIVDRYYPEPVPPPARVDLQKEAGLINGTYLIQRRPHSTFLNFALLTAPATRITVQKDNTVLVDDKILVPTGEPLTFRELKSGDRWWFFTRDGRTYYPTIPPVLYEKQTWSESAELHKLIFGFCSWVFLAALIGWPAAWIRRKKFSLAHALSWTVCLLFLAGFILLSLTFMSDFEKIMYEPAPLVPYLAVLLAAAGLAVIVVIVNIRAWVKGDWTLWGRLSYTAVTATMLLFTWELNYCNILGFKF